MYRLLLVVPILLGVACGTPTNEPAVEVVANPVRIDRYEMDERWFCQDDDRLEYLPGLGISGSWCEAAEGRPTTLLTVYMANDTEHDVRVRVLVEYLDPEGYRVDRVALDQWADNPREPGEIVVYLSTGGLHLLDVLLPAHGKVKEDGNYPVDTYASGYIERQDGRPVVDTEHSTVGTVQERPGLRSVHRESFDKIEEAETLTKLVLRFREGLHGIPADSRLILHPAAGEIITTAQLADGKLQEFVRFVAS